MTPLESGNLLHAEITESIIGGFYTVHKMLGYGFSEHVYSAVFEKELARRKLRANREVLVPIYYFGELACYQRLDMLVEDKIIVEIKTGERLREGSDQQLLNYLRCTRLEVGLLLYFGRKAHFSRLVHSTDYKELKPPGPGFSSAIIQRPSAAFRDEK